MNKQYIIALFFAVVLLIIFYGTSFLSQKKDIVVPDEPATTETAPFTLDTTYISTVDWPPVVRELDEIYSCTPVGDEYMRAGQTQKIIVDDKEYCQTKVSEGAAGSQYTQYAYLTEGQDGKTIATTFTLRFVQCMNYDEPNQSACLKEQSEFDVTQIIKEIFK